MPGSTGPDDEASPPGFAEFCRELLTRSGGGSRSWIVCANVDSTNSMARRLLARIRDRQGRLGSAAIAAWEQTAGRGRRGRDWNSSAGRGVYMTLVLPEVAPDLLPKLPFITACAVATSVSRLIENDVRVKWPNDVLWSGRKLAGLLVEGTSRGRGPSTAIVGIGINCLHGSDELPVPTATSLRLAGVDRPDMAGLALDVCAEVDRRLVAEPRMSAIVAELREWSAHRPGDDIRCRTGERMVDGRFAGFGEDGALLLERNGVTEEIRSSEIVEV